MPISHEAEKPAHLPRASSAHIRERWLDVLDLSHATRRVTYQFIEAGVHAIVIPDAYAEESKKNLLVTDIRAAMCQIPELVRGVRVGLESLAEFGLSLPKDFRQWMGQYAREVAEGQVRAMAFVDLAYLEAALLDRLWTAEVLVDFNSPLTFFRRGALLDYANVLEAVAAMVFEGRSLADTSARLAQDALARLQLYAQSFLKLSNLYTECAWRIERDTFVMELEMPGKAVSLALPYWELRGGAAVADSALEAWRARIETLLREVAPYAQPGFPRSFAA